VTDIDMDLKRIFDDRLSRYVPPAGRSSRPRRARLLVGALVATMAFALAGIAFDVESVAAANGGGCANVVAKLQMWIQKKTAAGATVAIDERAFVAKIAAEGGCVTTDEKKPSAPIPEKGQIAPKSP
jgi:hypothetical protein